MKKIDRSKNAKKRPKAGRHNINFFSKKNGVLVWLDSFLELQYALMMEFSNEVISYCSQPLSFHLSEKRRYTPDFLVEFSNSTGQYVEVHHSRFLDDKFWARFNGAQDILKEHDDPRELVLITDQMINPQVSENLKFLYPYLGECAPDLSILGIATGEIITLSTLTTHISQIPGYAVAAKARLAALTLIANRQFVIDFKTPLTENSPVMRASPC